MEGETACLVEQTGGPARKPFGTLSGASETRAVLTVQVSAVSS
jgi:hypothetical protein